MREFGKIHTSFWSSKTLDGLEADAKLLAVYLLTSPHTHASGAFRLPDAYACEDLGWEVERLRNGFETLSERGFIRRCNDTAWVWICKFGEWNKPDNPNIRKAIVKAVEAVPSSVSFRADLLATWVVSETVPKPLGNTPSPSPSPSPSLPLDDGSEFELTDEFAAELRQAYPRVDLAGELKKMRAWLVSNSANRKSRRGTPRFINSWLSKATPAVSGPVPPRRKELA